MIAIVPSATLIGSTGRPVTVEVHVSDGLPGFTVVGLPDAASGSPETESGPPSCRVDCDGLPGG